MGFYCLIDKEKSCDAWQRMSTDEMPQPQIYSALDKKISGGRFSTEFVPLSVSH